jgi:hypothetical protein
MLVANDKNREAIKALLFSERYGSSTKRLSDVLHSKESVALALVNNSRYEVLLSSIKDKLGSKHKTTNIDIVDDITKA